MDEVLYFAEMAEIESEKAQVMCESFDEYMILEERAQELKSYVSGESYYTEAAAAAAAEKKQSLIRRAWNKVVDFLKAVRDKIFGLFTNKTIADDAIVEVPKAYADKKNMSNLQKVVDKIKTISHSTTAKAIAAIISAIAIVLAGFGIYRKKKAAAANNPNAITSLTGKQLKTLAKYYETSTKTLISAAEGLAEIEARDGGIASTPDSVLGFANGRKNALDDYNLTLKTMVDRRNDAKAAFSGLRPEIHNLGRLLKTIGGNLLSAGQSATSKLRKLRKLKPAVANA